MKITLEKGHGTLNLNIDSKAVLGVLEGKNIPPIGHDKASLNLSQGIKDHAPKDINGKKVAVIIPDDTRLWARGDIFVPRIIHTLGQLHVPMENICIIIALGTHKDIPEDKFPLLCGKDLPKEVKIYNSAGLDNSRLVDVGSTSQGTRLTITKEAWEADHIIIFGGLLHHMLAGFGGGRKYILPGIAGEKSIQQNHSLAMGQDGNPHPMVRQAVNKGNPVSEDMADGANLFLKGKTCTYAAVAANGQGDIFYAHAGDLHKVFAQGCEKLNHACCADVGENGDFVLFSAGGHRTDTQLYQATKALFNAVNIANEGATLLFVAGCSEGVGNESFAHALKTFKNNPKALGKQLAEDFDMPAYVALRVIQMQQQFDIFLVSDLDEKLTQDLGFLYTPEPQALISSLAGHGYVIPFAENILPRVV